MFSGGKKRNINDARARLYGRVSLYKICFFSSGKSKRNQAVLKYWSLKWWKKVFHYCNLDAFIEKKNQLDFIIIARTHPSSFDLDVQDLRAREELQNDVIIIIIMCMFKQHVYTTHDLLLWKLEYYMFYADITQHFDNVTKRFFVPKILSFVSQVSFWHFIKILKRFFHFQIF